MHVSRLSCRKQMHDAVRNCGFLDWRWRYSHYPEHVFSNYWRHFEDDVKVCSGYENDYLTTAIQRLCDDFIAQNSSSIHLEFDRLGAWQNLNARLSPLSILAYKYAHVSEWNERQLGKVLCKRSRYEGYVLYAHEPLLDAWMAENGLHDLHVHLNCCQWHEPCWILALAYPGKELKFWINEKRRVRMLMEKIEKGLDAREMYFRLKLAAKIRCLLMYFVDDHDSSDLFEDFLGRIDHLSDRFVFCRKKCNRIFRAHREKEYGEAIQEELIWMSRMFIGLRHDFPQGVRTLFHVYLLIKNQHFQLCSQRDDLSGFSQFQAYTDMDRGFGEHASYYVHVFQCLHGAAGHSKVRYLEGRVSMKGAPSAAEASFCKVLCAYGRYMADRLQDTRFRGSGRLSFLLPELKQMIKKAKRSGDRFMALALVVHLIKWPWKAGKNSSRRYPDTRDAAESQASLLVEMLQRCRDLRSWVRGLDAAADELDAPAEVFAPAYRYARASRMIGHFTFHCGEDFHHLLGGIRAVGEAVMFLDLQRGDRVGHATALGIDPSLWLRRMPSSVCSERGRLLQDLVYAWSVLRKIGRVGREYVAKLEEKACELGRAVFKKSVTMDLLSAVFLLLPYHPKCVKNWLGARSRFHMIRAQGTRSLLGWAHERFYEEVILKHIAEDAMRLAVDWESSSGVLMRCQEMVELETEFLPAELYVELQQYVLRDLAKKGIVIESLPTSNTRISVYEDVSEHHILRWMGVDGFKKEGDPVVLVALGSDDPGVFSTDIKAEFYHVYALLRKAGLSDYDALRKLDELNQRGAACCFHDKSLYA